MADLRSSTVVGAVTASSLKDSGGVNGINLDAMDSESRYLRHIETLVDEAAYSTTTTWITGPTFSPAHIFKAGSLIRLFYYAPCRNDSTGWNGAMLEPQINLNGGGWQSLGSSGYGGNVMTYSKPSIGSYVNTLIIDPGMVEDFTVAFQLKYRAYVGTALINGSHAINTLSGTGTLMTGVNGSQHFFHVILEEYARLDGGT